MSFVSFPIQQFFPRDQYETACRKKKGGNPQLIPFYLIALNQPLKKIREQYEKSGRDPNYREPTYQLTALSVATMVKSHEVMRYLVNLGANLTCSDRSGLTPLHYACALQDTQSLNILGDKRKIFEIFPSWKKMISPPLPKKGTVIPGVYFYDGVWATWQAFVNLLAQRLKEEVPLYNEDLVFKFYEYEKKPPKLSLSSQAGQGVIAGEDIQPGRICALYSGKVNFRPTNDETADYVFRPFDASEVRNFGSMINDGFPNCRVMRIYFPDGRVYAVLIALDFIKAGSSLSHDYSMSHRVKFKEAHKEIHQPELESFFRLKTPQEWVFTYDKGALSNEAKNSLDKALPYFLIRERLTYLINTPTSLLSLFLKEILSEEDIVFLNQPEILSAFIEKEQRVYYQQFCQLVHLLNKLFRQGSPSKTAISTMLLGLIGNYSFRTISTLSSLMCSYPPRFLNLEFGALPSVIPDLDILAPIMIDVTRAKNMDSEVLRRSWTQLDKTPLLKMVITNSCPLLKRCIPD